MGDQHSFPAAWPPSHHQRALLAPQLHIRPDLQQNRVKYSLEQIFLNFIIDLGLIRTLHSKPERDQTLMRKIKW